MNTHINKKKTLASVAVAAALALTCSGVAVASHTMSGTNPGSIAVKPANAQALAQTAPEAIDDAMQVIDGKVYEFDDGKWEPESDKKIENGQVYEYDDGVWEAENDKYVQDNVIYEYDDTDDDDDDWDDDDDRDDDRDDDDDDDEDEDDD